MSGCLVQDVAKAGSADGFERGPEGQGEVADRRLCADDARRVEAAFRDRIGAERHAVWFGDAAVVDVWRTGSGEACATIRIGNAFTLEWLRKTFQRDFVAAVRQICGKAARAEWLAVEVADQPLAEPVAERPVPPEMPRRSGRPVSGRAAATGRPVSEAVAASGETAEEGSAAGPLPRRAVASQPHGGRPVPRLDTFIVGPSNRMAFAAVELAAGRPGEMSPLVLHGPSGSGKTHLLEAVCGEFRARHPKANAVYLSAEQFTTGFLQALHGTGLPGFRRTCRTADLLAVDDLQFFVGKRATIMELQQTIEALHRLGRQIVFACDREPESITELGAELLSRLRGGMTARMLPPDEDVRRGIVKAIAARRRLDVPDDVVHYVAMHMARHARELAGALNRLEATSHMLGLPITLGMAEEALADLVRTSGRSVRLADIERAVCSAFGIEPGSLQTSRRARRVNHPRMLAMFLARKHTPAALTEIGSYFGRRSHSTVISAQKTVADWVSKRERIVLADATWDVDDAIRHVEEFIRAG